MQLLDRRAGRPLHPPPRWSFGSPPPSRPTGRGAADGPLVRTHSRAARRSGLAVRIRTPRGGRRRHPRRRRARGRAARGVPQPSASSGWTAIPAALQAARERLSPFGDRVTFIAAPFSTLESVLSDPGFGPLAGVLLDLGVSSPQLDWSERGFSFREDGPLDMRMDPTSGPTAADLVNTLPVEALAALFRENGEGRLSGRIARAVVQARPLTSTRQLAEVVASAVPAPARRKGHPARRVFQALRIEVNDELGELAAALPAALSHLAVGGVCAVISYHSGEDRLTKQIFADAASGGCVCPPGLPCVCGAVVRHQLVFRGARSRRRRRSPPTPAPRALACGAIVRTEPATWAPRAMPTPRTGRPDAATARGDGDGDAPARRRHIFCSAPSGGTRHRSSFHPAHPAPGRPDSHAARHSRGPRRCESGKAPHHRVRGHGRGRAAGRRRGPGFPGQRPGAAGCAAASADAGAERAPPGRAGRGQARDAAADRGRRHQPAPHGRRRQRHRAAVRLPVRAPPHPEGDARTRSTTADNLLGGCGRADGEWGGSGSSTSSSTSSSGSSSSSSSGTTSATTTPTSTP